MNLSDNISMLTNVITINGLHVDKKGKMDKKFGESTGSISDKSDKKERRQTTAS